jgi:hypothetical protein
MTNSDAFFMQPAEVTDATTRLDQLAERVETLMRNEAPHLTVTAAGRDEVSTRVAENLNEVHTTFGTATDHGAREIREIAATLRAHTDHIAAAEQDFTL